MNRVRTVLTLAAALSVGGMCLAAAAAPDGGAPPPPSTAAMREIEIVVDGGYSPSRVTVAAGEAVRLRFIRRDYSPCSREVVFASLGIRRELPTDVPVVIDLPALPAGEIEFKCGMSMLRGVIAVEPPK